MTCTSCHKRHTFNMNCRQCQVKWLRQAYKPSAHAWLKAYRAEHGEAEMLRLIAEVKSHDR